MRRVLLQSRISRDMPLFAGIPEQSVDSVLNCMQARLISFDAGDSIRDLTGDDLYAKYLWSGHALGVTYDADGNKTILAEYGPRTVISCGAAFDMPRPVDFAIVAHERCEIVYFSMAAVPVCKRCHKYVEIVKGNLMQSVAQLNAGLMETLDIRSRRSTRGKIVAYLEREAKRQGSTSFDIPFNRQELADYLCVDRAALSRELSHLHAEGQIDYEHSHFDLYLRPKGKA